MLVNLLGEKYDEVKRRKKGIEYTKMMMMHGKESMDE